MRRIAYLTAAIVLTAIPAIAGEKELTELQEILPKSETFDQWLKDTHELPPDFDSLPTSADPPDIFTTMEAGKPVKVTRENWPHRREELRNVLETWFFGHAPPAPHVNAVIENKFTDRGNDVWQVRLEMTAADAPPGQKITPAKLYCWLFMSPKLKKPAPVFLVDNFKYTRFAADALEKGSFAVCVYNAADPAYVEFMPAYVVDRGDESAAYNDAFGKYDWSEFRRRGWSASRAVDWLSTLDIVDAKHIYIGGHSRSAKQAMAGAAFDDRIAGVIASSPGSGGSLCFRDCDQYYYGESAELLTRVFPKWVSPKVRFFVGRENKLPGDMHFLYALLAPRSVLMSTATNDDVENTWAVEHMYDLVHPVWQMLGAEGNLALRYRPGPHAPDDQTYHDYSKFLEAMVTGQKADALFPYHPIHVWNYDRWLAANKPADVNALPDRSQEKPSIGDDGKPISAATWPAKREVIRSQINWLLGDGPRYAPMPVDLTKGESDEEATRLRRPQNDHQRITFGDHIHGSLYRPPAAATSPAKHPAIIWLAPLQTSQGYVPGYREGDIPYYKWAKAGYVVLAFDPIATGGRQDERRDFYTRYPRWSLMGKMVFDARCAIDALSAVDDVDRKQIHLVGFGMGGMAGVFTAAVDDRVAGVVSVAGFTPFRADTDARITGGIHRWSHLYGWLPQLGPFIGHEPRIPVDFNDTLAAAAPTPMLIVSPTLDWHENHGDVERAVNEANEAYKAIGAKAAITLDSPVQACEFDNDMQARVLEWLKEQRNEKNVCPHV